MEGLSIRDIIIVMYEFEMCIFTCLQKIQRRHTYCLIIVHNNSGSVGSGKDTYRVQPPATASYSDMRDH